MVPWYIWPTVLPKSACISCGTTSGTVHINTGMLPRHAPLGGGGGGGGGGVVPCQGVPHHLSHYCNFLPGAAWSSHGQSGDEFAVMGKFLHQQLHHCARLELYLLHSASHFLRCSKNRASSHNLQLIVLGQPATRKTVNSTAAEIFSAPSCRSADSTCIPAINMQRGLSHCLMLVCVVAERGMCADTKI